MNFFERSLLQGHASLRCFPRVYRLFSSFHGGFPLQEVPRSQENASPPRTAVGAYAYAHCRVLGDGVFL